MPQRFKSLRTDRVLIAPSILSADFADLAGEIESVTAGEDGADLIHIDVMDGHFVPNLTMGPAVVSSLRERFPEVCLDCHLMVEEPARYIEAFAEAGADAFTFHAETVSNPDDAARLAELIREHGMAPGLALNPATHHEWWVNNVEAFDIVLVMSVVPGFSGQKFMAEVLEKVRDLASAKPAGQRISIDGGINLDTAPAAVTAGADILAAASAVFSPARSERAGVVDRLRHAWD